MNSLLSRNLKASFTVGQVVDFGGNSENARLQTWLMTFPRRARICSLLQVKPVYHTWKNSKIESSKNFLSYLLVSSMEIQLKHFEDFRPAYCRCSVFPHRQKCRVVTRSFLMHYCHHIQWRSKWSIRSAVFTAVFEGFMTLGVNNFSSGGALVMLLVFTWRMKRFLSILVGEYPISLFLVSWGRFLSTSESTYTDARLY